MKSKNNTSKLKETITFEQEYRRIGEINLKKGVTPALGLCKLFEEAGELAQAVNVDIGIKNGPKSEIKSNVKEECADMIQNAFSIANLFKIQPQELLDELNRKNTTWETVKRKADPKRKMLNIKLKLIIAVDKNGVMGDKNKLPWKLSDDLKQFKQETLNSPLIMGSNTFKSLPGILPNREHIVLSKNMDGNKNMSVFTSIKNAMEYLDETEYPHAFVIGGANVVKQFAHYNMFDEMIITHVNCKLKGDTILDLDEDLKLENWDIYRQTNYAKSEKNQYDFVVNRYIKKKKRFY